MNALQHEQLDFYNTNKKDFEKYKGLFIALKDNKLACVASTAEQVELLMTRRVQQKVKEEDQEVFLTPDEFLIVEVK